MIMAKWDDAKHTELHRVNWLVEAHEKVNNLPQRAMLYGADPTLGGDDVRKYVFGGDTQVKGIDAALAVVKSLADGYAIDWRSGTENVKPTVKPWVTSWMDES